MEVVLSCLLLCGLAWMARLVPALVLLEMKGTGWDVCLMPVLIGKFRPIDKSREILDISSYTIAVVIAGQGSGK
jgi:hypothetical protein